MSGPALVFRHCGQHFLLEAAAVSEVVPMPPVTRVPLAPPFILGVANHHGSVLPVIDSDALLSVTRPPGAERGGSALVVGELGNRLVLPVDATVGLEHVGPSPDGEGSLPGVVTLRGKAVSILRFSELLRRLAVRAEAP